MNNFKKLDKIAFKITSKIFKKYDYNLIKIFENWEKIVGKKFSMTTSPKKISKNKSLIVFVESKVVMDFEYFSPEVLKKVSAIIGKDIITNIKILQKVS